MLLWAFLLILAAGFCADSARAEELRPLSGAYKVIRATDVGKGLCRVALRIHIQNPSVANLPVQRLTMPREPAARAGHAVSLEVPSHGSGEITQDFTVPTGEYRHWLRGGPLVLLLGVPGPDGKTRNMPVRLRPSPVEGVR